MFRQIECEFSAPKVKTGKADAYCDVKLIFESGTLLLRGFRIMPGKDGNSWVSPPAKKGRTEWFDQIVVTGELRKGLYGEMVRAYLAWRRDGQ